MRVFNRIGSQTFGLLACGLGFGDYPAANVLRHKRHAFGMHVTTLWWIGLHERFAFFAAKEVEPKQEHNEAAIAGVVQSLFDKLHGQRKRRIGDDQVVLNRVAATDELWIIHAASGRTTVFPNVQRGNVVVGREQVV